VDFDAERPSDILANHADLRFPQAQVQRGDVLHHVRRLRALIDGEPRFGCIPVRNDRSRLQRHAGVAAEDEIGLDHFVGFGKGLIDLSRNVNAFPRQIVAERGMDDRRGRIERGAHIRYRFQLLVLHRDELGRILGHGAAGRHNGRNRLALPANAIDRERVLRCGFQTLQVGEDAHPRRDDSGKLLPRHDGDHPRHALRRGGVDA
jgi:hypothetical protein